MKVELNDGRFSVRQMANIFAATVSLLVSSAAALVILMMGDNTDVSVYADVLLPNVLAECKPERDIVAYGVFVVLFPVLYAVLIHLTRRLFDNGDSLLNPSWPRNVVLLWDLLVAAIATTYIRSLFSNPDYADKYLYGSDRIFLALICAVFLFAICFAHRKGRFLTANRIAAVVVSVAFVLFVLYVAGNYNYMFSGTFYNLHHYSAWWNPIYKVGSGMTLGDGFNELYGFYPYLVVPVLKFFGGVNQQSVSLYMSLVYVIMAVCIFVFCNRFFKNKLLGVLCVPGFFALGPMAYFGNTELYFQYYPTRALFVFIILGIIALYCSTKKFRKLIAVSATVVCALAIFWNTESGMVATVVWSGFLILDKAIDHRLNDKVLLKRIAVAVLSAVISVVLFVLIAESVTYIRSGSLLGIEDVLFGILTFSGMGFYMLPLEKGIWTAILFALVYGLFVAVPHLAFVRKKAENFVGDRDNVIALFMTSVAGLGSFMYFMGRSYYTNCMTFLPWVVLICALIADKNVSEWSLERLKPRRIFIFFTVFARNAVCFVAVGISMAASLAMAGNALDKNSEINRIFKQEQPGFQQLADQIVSWKDNECGGETPYVFNTYAAFVQELAGIPARENVYEQINWFRYSDAHTYIDFINAHPDVPFTIDESGLSTLKTHFLSEWETLEHRYDLVDVYEWDVYVANDIVNNVYLFVPVVL